MLANAFYSAHQRGVCWPGLDNISYSESRDIGESFHSNTYFFPMIEAAPYVQHVTTFLEGIFFPSEVCVNCVENIFSACCC